MLHPIDSLHRQSGDCISGDQLESTQQGIIPIYKGSPSTSFYNSGTFLVNHASRFLHFTPHKLTRTHEAIQTKKCFELIAHSFNHSICQYQTDNGLFAHKPFKQACISNNQYIAFCSINAHHQNSIIKSYIKL
jgi:hypothetical protein